MPEPVLVSIAAALAAKSATSLYELVKTRFARRAEAAAALEAAAGAAPESTEVATLAAELEREERQDPQFQSDLRSQWDTVATQLQADHGAVNNQITGNVSGKVLQARDIQGGISF
ncbi:hypothetical protein [Actinokineospora sp. NBRC 105648]|uniref:hypothetical protein n=1 Tax=Actinokineospora sp. NBRC 105648 TaxID=3032206 RepID=UPI0024A3B7AD|nr:hypothetical protein [Actinokineospora sp. NBRC 105648]GLZ36506.1 hypothetical protein Acsp05_01310 [Actinokineospora sp. NBRC 105648]